MPYLMDTAFDQFLERITIGGDLRSLATTRRNNIVDLLEGQMETLDVFPTGSLVRGTGLKGSSDVDIVAVLHYSKHIKDKTCTQLLESVQQVLSEYDARIVKKNGQAVTLYFKTWPNVDLVPAKRVTNDSKSVLYIPDANTGEWIRTNPALHDATMSKLPLRRRQLVRMIKCWNAAHSGYVLSFHIEQIALECHFTTDSSDWAEDDWPYAVLEFFEKADDYTSATGQNWFQYTTDDWLELRPRVERAKGLALEAWSAAYNGDNEKAMGRLRLIFGDRFPAYG